MKKLQLAATTLSSLLFSATFFAQNAFAQTPVEVSIAKSKLVRTPELKDIISFIVTAAVVLAILLSLLFILIGAINWITSSGDKAKVESARNHIVAALIGLVIIVLAVAILNFVLNLLGIGSLFGTGFTVPALKGD